MNKTIKLLLTFTFIFVIISTINIKYTYAANSTIDMNLVDNLIPNSSSSSNSTTNNSDSGILAPDYKDSNSLGENKSSSSGAEASPAGNPARARSARHDSGGDRWRAVCSGPRQARPSGRPPGS